VRTPRTIAIWTEKGGTGKSTTAVNLASALAARGRRVLVVDLDPQGTATDWIGWRPEEGTPLLSVLTEMRRLGPLVQASRAPGVSLVPSDGRPLKRAEHALRAEIGGERRLAVALAPLFPSFDYILCDTPPAAGALAAAALEACSEALVPLDNSSMSAVALASVVDTLRRCVLGGCEIQLLGVLLCRYTPGTRISRELVTHLQEVYPDTLLRTRIHEATKWRECFSHGLPMNLYAPDSLAAANFSDLAAEVESRSPLPLLQKEVEIDV
jgi:chromosome partitioning protein